jgi:REP element-mobilizing transposase RayT
MKQGVKHTIKKNSRYFLTLTVVEWIDVFTRKNHKDAIVDSLRYCIENKGLNIYSFCLMSNHLHLIANCNEPFELKDVIRDFKKFSSKKILNQILNEPESRREWMLKEFTKAADNSPKHKNYKFWQEGNHAIELYNEKFTWDKINYIHMNPVEEGFVNHESEWKYSSASNYHGKESILPEVYCIPARLQTIR